MAIHFDVKWKFNVNGKKYGSVDEMPGPVRDAYEKARKYASDPAHGSILSATTTRIVFNGKEYSNVDAMPTETRQLYQGIMEAFPAGEAASGDEDGKVIGGAATARKAEDFPVSSDVPGPIAPEAFSSRKRIVGAVILILLAGLYYLVHMADFW